MALVCAALLAFAFAFAINPLNAFLRSSSTDTGSLPLRSGRVLAEPREAQAPPRNLRGSLRGPRPPGRRDHRRRAGHEPAARVAARACVLGTRWRPFGTFDGPLWLLDPLARTLETYRLAELRWVPAATHAGDGPIRAVPFDAAELTMRR